MNPTVQPRRVVHLSVPKVVPDAQAAANDSTDASSQVCGWYDSSFALRQGLAVSELPDSDGTVAALWFAARDSSCLQ